MILNYLIELNLEKNEHDDMDEHDINTIHQYCKTQKNLRNSSVSSVHVMLNSLQIQLHGIL